MQITREQAEQRLKAAGNLSSRFSKSSPADSDSKTQTIIEIPIHVRGQKHGSTQLPLSVKNEIAIRARLGEKQGPLAKEFGTTQATVSNIEIGKTATSAETVTPAIATVQEQAISRLLTSLGLLDADKMSGCNAKDLSTIASNMAKVVNQTMPKEKSDNGVQVIIYTPEQRNEGTFRSVEV